MANTKRVALYIDEDAVDLLEQLAPSESTRGQFISSLIRSAAQARAGRGRYITAALDRAKYETLESGMVYGEIPGLQGVWASAATADTCRAELEGVLDGWLILHAERGRPVPVLAGIDLNGPPAA